MDKATLFEVLSERGLALQNVHFPASKDRHLVMAAVQQAGMALEFADAVRELIISLSLPIATETLNSEL